DDEIETHLRLLTERYVRQGMSQDEAARAARRQFGNVTLLQEVNREMRGIRSIDTLVQDLRYGVRMLRKNPGFPLNPAIPLALGMGMGADTAIFSLTSALVLRPFDFHDLDRLVWVYESAHQRGNDLSGMTPADFAYLRWRQTVFADLAAFRWSNSNLTGVGEP